MTRLLGVQGVIGTVVTAVVLGFAVPPAGAACPPDSVESGPVCIDKYEASLWHVPPTMRALIKRIQNGTVTLANLTAPAALAAGVAHVGLTPAVSSSNDLEDAGCPVAGNGCLDVYAVSIPGVRPSTGMSWAQAAAAARNSQKRLPTNQEWQVAALGTPEGATCPNPSTVAATGSNPACVSDVGAVDMVGNAHEWVADWIPGTTGCGAPCLA